MKSDKSRKIFYSLTLIFVTISVALVSYSLGAASGEPGSENNPLVAYDLFNSVKETLEKRIADVETTVKGIDGVEYVVYSNITLESGKAVIISGTSEVILKGPGRGVLITEDDATSIIDISDGKTLRDRDVMPNYHTYIFSADSENGITPMGNTAIDIMIKGNYKIVDYILN